MLRGVCWDHHSPDEASLGLHFHEEGNSSCLDSCIAPGLTDTARGFALVSDPLAVSWMLSLRAITLGNGPWIPASAPGQAEWSLEHPGIGKGVSALAGGAVR